MIHGLDKYLQEEENMQDQECEVAREPVSQKVLSHMDNISILAEKLSERVCHRLDPITSQPQPKPAGENKLKDDCEYPELFSTMRSLLKSIEQSLARINDCIDRVEV